MAEHVNKTCVCRAKIVCHQYADTVTGNQHLVIVVERSVGQKGVILYCPFCRRSLKNREHSCNGSSATRKAKKKKPCLDKTSRRIDALPGETEKEYRRRITPLARENRKAEISVLRVRARALKRI
jgi:hypothetical protein